mgnify:CR=1 FL=1
MSKNPKYTVEYLKILKEQKKTRDLTSNFTLLNAHNGLRKGKLHLFLAPTSGGKSTLGRSLLFDALDNNPDLKVFVYLSEESEDNFLKELADSDYENQNGLDRLTVYSEIDNDDKISANKLLFLMEESETDLLIIDNITTAHFYQDQKTQVQGIVVNKIKNICVRRNIPVIVMAHTGAEVTDNMRRTIESNDIRGSKTIVNYAEFLYVLQSFSSDEYDSLMRKRITRIYSTIVIKKSRGEHCDHQLFFLKYDSQKRIYFADREMEFQEFKNLFKERNHL